MKKRLCIIYVMMLSISLSGCWSRYEPKTLALIDSAIYDLGDKGGYQVTIEVQNPAAQGGPKGGGDGKSPSITVTGMGSSFPEALRNTSESLEKTIFAGHVKVRLFSESFARNDIMAVTDYLLRDNLTDEHSLMVVIRDEDPQKVYTCLLGLSDTVGDYLDNISETQPNTTSKSVFVTTLDFIKDSYNEGKQPVAGVVSLVECEEKPSDNTDTGTDTSQNSQSSQGSSDKKYRIIYGGLAAFKDGKLAGYMDETEARAYNFITNNIARAVVSIPRESSETVVIVQNPKAEIKTEITNDELTLNVKIKTRMSIIQESSAIDISKMEPLKTVEAAFNQQLTEEVTTAIKKAQTEFQSDIFGFGVSVHKQHPKEWKEIKENWDDYFAKAKINVSVESTVARTGEIKQPFGLETES